MAVEWAEVVGNVWKGESLSHWFEKYISSRVENGHGCHTIAMVTTDPIRKGTTRGRLPGDTSEMMIECCLVGKRQPSRSCITGNKCFVSLAEMTLASVTFSPASHHSLLFFILCGYTSASEIRDFLVLSSLWALWGSTFSPMLLEKCKRISLLKYPGYSCYIKVPKKHLLACTSQCEAELITSKHIVLFQ